MKHTEHAVITAARAAKKLEVSGCLESHQALEYQRRHVCMEAMTAVKPITSKEGHI